MEDKLASLERQLETLREEERSVLERTVGVVVTPYLQLTTPYQRAFGCMQFRCINFSFCKTIFNVHVCMLL